MKAKGKRLAIAGAVLQLGLVLGFAGTALGMFSAFQTMGPEGMENPEALANDIGFALITTAIGLSAALVGLVLVFVALFGSKYRAPWFFWFLVVFSILWIFNFPVGIILGAGLLVYLTMHRNEFKTPPNQQQVGVNKHQ